MTKKTTKRSLAMSIISLVLCLAMLIGSTYAWFSDEATTKEVTITAGNLDVEIVKDTVNDLSQMNKETDVLSGEGKFLFDQDKLPELWEPGMMVTSKEFKIANLGTLALKYQLNVTKTAKEGKSLPPVKFKVGKTEGNEKLTTLLGKVESGDATLAERQAAWKALTGADELTSATLVPKDDNGEDGLTEAMIIVLFWEPTDSTAKDNFDNLFNKPDTAFDADFKVDLFATQAVSEKDTFGDKYDEGIKMPTAQSSSLSVPTKGGVLPLTESSEKTTSVKGKGTVALAEGVEIQNKTQTSTNTNVSLDCGNGLGKSELTLAGAGTVKAPTGDKTGFAVRVNTNTTVTVESGTYEGFYIYSSQPNEKAKNPKLTIKGGKVTGFVNIYDKLRTEDNKTDKIVIIENVDAVRDAFFQMEDSDWIQVPKGYALTKVESSALPGNTDAATKAMSWGKITKNP